MSVAAPLQVTTAKAKRSSLSPGSGFLQRKLTIGASNDPLEQEADRVADQVMAMPEGSAIGRAAPRINKLSRWPAEVLAVASPSMDHVLTSPGRPLKHGLRREMEQRFGHDFSRVRIYADAAAGISAHDINAVAYTVNNNIVFGASHYAPETQEGKRLIAHELTHTLQAGSSSIIHRKVKRVGYFSPSKAREYVEGIIWMFLFEAWLYKEKEHVKHPEQFPLSLRDSLASDLQWFENGIDVVNNELNGDSNIMEKLKKAYRASVAHKIYAAAIKENRPIYDIFKSHNETLVGTDQRDVIHELAGQPHLRMGELYKEIGLDKQDQAALPVLRECLCNSARTGMEYCGHIFLNSQTGAYRASPIGTSNLPGYCESHVNYPLVEQPVAYYHSHPRGQGDEFSEAGQNGRTTGDIDMCQNRGLDCYLVNSRGEVLRYTHTEDETTDRGTTTWIGKLPECAS